VRAPEPAKPAFSPFEADRNRKAADERGPAPLAEIRVEPVAELIPPVRALTPLEATARAVETASAKASDAAAEVPEEITPELTAEPVGAIADAETAPSVDLDRIREAVFTALNEKGHNTAAVLIDAGKWSLDGDTIRVEAGIKKTMLGLTMNIEAEKIVKNALRAVGASQKLIVVPGENGAVNSDSKPRVVSGSVQAAALENPLVKQAMDLFGAEVRSVLDLRDTK
jgi:DNA polymerase-3 subunit gamma/tau